MGDQFPVFAAEGGHVVRFDPRPVIVPVAAAITFAVFAVILTGDISGSWFGSASAVSLFFRRTWLVTRRKVAFAVGPSGVYLGTTLGRPRQRPELIPWEEISALEVSLDRTDDGDQMYVFVRGIRRCTAAEDASIGEHGPRIAYRKVDGWYLDRQAVEHAVRRYGSLTTSSERLLPAEDDVPPAA